MSKRIKPKGPAKRDKKHRDFKAHPPKVPGWAQDVMLKGYKNHPAGRINPSLSQNS